MKISTSKTIRDLTASGVCLALCLVLPFLTGQIREIGNMLCPMHIPVLLAGFVCGPWWGLAVGFIAPLLRHLIFTMPKMPSALGMAFELAAYGCMVGVMYRFLRGKIWGIYASLLTSMVGGRLIWGCAMALILGIGGSGFTWNAFLTGAVLNAVPGIVLQIVLVPIIVLALRRARLVESC